MLQHSELETIRVSAYERTRLWRLLIVEERLTDISALSDVLEKEGLEAILCTSAAEALKHVYRDDISVAIVDPNLPDLKSTRLLQRLRQKRDRIRVIIHTEKASHVSAKEAMNLGAFAYVEKTCECQELLCQVHRALWTNFDRYALELEFAIYERNQAQKALECAREAMELRVLERTTELEQINLALKEEITERTQIESTLQKREQQLLQALEFQEAISQDLHDSVLQSCYALGLGLEASKQQVMKNPTAALESIRNAIAQINSLMRDIRYFITGLDVSIHQPGDFKVAIQEVVAKLSCTQPVDFKLAIEGAAGQLLTRKESMHLTYIVQEALSNSLRHGGAKICGISLGMKEKSILLEIWDDGSGFIQQDLGRGGHGLKNMAARARKICGHFSIDSRPEKGTRIVVRLDR